MAVNPSIQVTSSQILEGLEEFILDQDREIRDLKESLAHAKRDVDYWYKEYINMKNKYENRA